jgi:hypothetical protein
MLYLCTGAIKFPPPFSVYMCVSLFSRSLLFCMQFCLSVCFVCLFVSTDHSVLTHSYPHSSVAFFSSPLPSVLSTFQLPRSVHGGGSESTHKVSVGRGRDRKCRSRHDPKSYHLAENHEAKTTTSFLRSPLFQHQGSPMGPPDSPWGHSDPRSVLAQETGYRPGHHDHHYFYFTPCARVVLCGSRPMVPTSHDGLCTSTHL